MCECGWRSLFGEIKPWLLSKRGWFGPDWGIIQPISDRRVKIFLKMFLNHISQNILTYFWPPCQIFQFWKCYSLKRRRIKERSCNGLKQTLIRWLLTKNTQQNIRAIVSQVILITKIDHCHQILSKYQNVCPCETAARRKNYVLPKLFTFPRPPWIIQWTRIFCPHVFFSWLVSLWLDQDKEQGSSSHTVDNPSVISFTEWPLIKFGPPVFFNL